MDKNNIAEIIEMTETLLQIKRGSLRWGIKGTTMAGERYMCGYFSYNDHDFVHILAPIESYAEDDPEMVSDILWLENEVMEQIPKVLGAYGLTSLLQNVGMKGMKFMFVANIREENIKPYSVDLTKISLN